MFTNVPNILFDNGVLGTSSRNQAIAQPSTATATSDDLDKSLRTDLCFPSCSSHNGAVADHKLWQDWKP